MESPHATVRPRSSYGTRRPQGRLILGEGSTVPGASLGGSYPAARCTQTPRPTRRVHKLALLGRCLFVSEAYGAVIGGSVALVLAAIAWLIRDWRVVVVVYAFLGVIAGLGLLAATDAWP